MKGGRLWSITTVREQLTLKENISNCWRLPHHSPSWHLFYRLPNSLHFFLCMYMCVCLCVCIPHVYVTRLSYFSFLDMWLENLHSTVSWVILTSPLVTALDLDDSQWLPHWCSWSGIFSTRVSSPLPGYPSLNHVHLAASFTWVLFATQSLTLFWEAVEVPESHPCSPLPTVLALGWGLTERPSSLWSLALCSFIRVTGAPSSSYLPITTHSLRSNSSPTSEPGLQDLLSELAGGRRIFSFSFFRFFFGQVFSV